MKIGFLVRKYRFEINGRRYFEAGYSRETIGTNFKTFGDRLENGKDG
jgi:hypothetical protein